MSTDESKRVDDFSPEHLTWLVNQRSSNQISSLRLYLLIREHLDKIKADLDLTNSSQALIAVVFSLWRAVFLSDLSENNENLMKDAETFLGNLVLHNAVAYPQDRNAREWTFAFYINNARYRLKAFVDDPQSRILSSTDFDFGYWASDKDLWIYLQTAANRAIENLGKLLTA